MQSSCEALSRSIYSARTALSLLLMLGPAQLPKSMDPDPDSTCSYILLLTGMKCGGCVGHVKKLLEEHPAVVHATVNLATETALVRVTLAQGADLDKLAAELAQVGADTPL